MDPRYFARRIVLFLTECSVSLSVFSQSLFFFFFYLNRFVFRSIRLVITRTQSSIFLLLERLLQCDGQIVRNNYTKWRQKKKKKSGRKDLSLLVIRFISDAVNIKHVCDKVKLASGALPWFYF